MTGSEYKGWPNPDIDPELKDSEYDRSCCHAIIQEYDRGEMAISIARSQDMEIARMYADANQPIDKYTEFWPKDDDGNPVSFINLDYSPIGLMRKFVRMAKANISDSVGEISLQAYDPVSVDERESIEAFTKVYMNTSVQRQMQSVGIEPPASIPRNQMEFDIAKMVGNKIGVELAGERFLKIVNRDNDYRDVVIPDISEEICNTDVGAIYTYIDDQGAIVKQVVDSSQLIVSSSRKKDFSDSRVKGFYEEMTIQEIKAETSGYFSEEEYLMIAKSANTDKEFWRAGNDPKDYLKDGYYEYDGFKTFVYRLFWHDTDKYIREKKYLEDKPDEFVYRDRKYDWEPGVEGKEKVVVSVPKMRTAMCVKTAQASKGVLVWENGVLQNIIRDDSKKPICPLSIVRVSKSSPNLSVSFTEQLAKAEDALQALWNRMLNAIAQAKDPNVAINVNAVMNALDIVEAEKITDVINSWASGNPLPFAPADMPGNVAGSAPVIGTPVMNAVNDYLQQVGAVMALMGEISGATSVAAASQPNPNLLNGVAEKALAQSVKVLRDMQVATRKLIKQDCEVTERYLKRIIEEEDLNGDGYYKEMFSEAGRQVLKLAKDIPNRRLSIFIEVGMNEDQINQFATYVWQAVSARTNSGKNGLEWDVALQLLEDYRRSPKEARYRLRYELQKQRENDMKMEMMKAYQAQQAGGEMQAQKAKHGMIAQAAKQDGDAKMTALKEKAATDRVLISSAAKLLDTDDKSDSAMLPILQRMVKGTATDQDRATLNNAIQPQST